MKPRLILVSLGLAALTILSFSLQAQDQPKSIVQEKDDIITSEQQLLRQFTEFTEALLRLQQKMAKGTPEERERAKVLDKVLDECRNLAINQEFTKMIELMRSARVNNPGDIKNLSDQSNTLGEKLRRILELMQDTSGTKLSDQTKDLRKLIEDLEKTIAREKTAEALIERDKTEKKELKDLQADITKATAEIAKKLQELQDKDKNPKGGEAAPTKGENKDAGKDSQGAKGEAKDAGKNQKSEGSKGEPKDAGKDSKGSKGETKPGQDKDSKPKSGDSEPKATSKKGDKDKEGSPDANAKGDKNDKGDKTDKGSSKENKTDKGDKNDKKNEGASKDAGKTGDPMKDMPPASAKGDDKDSKPSGGDPKPMQGAPDAKPKPGGGEPMAGGGDQKPPVASKESKGSDKGGEGKSGGEAKGGEGKQGEAKSGAAAGQGQAKEGGPAPAGGGAPPPPPGGADKSDSPPPPPSSDPKKSKDADDVANSIKKLKEAGYDQQSAEKEIAKEQKEKALKNVADAIQKMEDAKKKLEKLLRQMREEEIERVLAALQARCEKMLIMQTQVYVGTKDTEAAIKKNPDKKPIRTNTLAAQSLSDKEKEIITEANKCIIIIEAEGSAVAFPEVFQQLRQDMIHVQKRLDVTDVYDVTQGIELDIISSLKDMIDALKKARDDNQSPPSDGKPGEGKSGPPADPKLLELIQELKMVRALQKRVNERTEMYGKRFPGEQANDPQVVRELRNLGERQQRIQDIVSRISKGDNK